MSLLIEKEKEVNSLFKKISDELLTAKKRFKANGGNEFIYDDFVKQLPELNVLWKPYRDKLCEAKTQLSADGSGYDGFLRICKLYETDKYISLLKDFENSWIK